MLDTKRYIFNAFVSVLLIIFGASLIFWVTLRQGHSTLRVSDSKSYGLRDNNKVDQTVLLGDQITEIGVDPVKLSIAKIERELEVSDGFVLNNHWTISSTGVSYLTTSGKLGKKGNVVLYGHNTRDVLGGLWRVQNGDFVEVTADNGRVYKYEVFERHEVKPNQVEILDQTDDARLTLFTCSGFLDSARFVVVGKLVSGS